VDANGNPVTFDPRFPDDSYFLKTNAKDEQYAAFGELTYALTERVKATVGARFSRTKFSFDTLTGGPQLFDVPRPWRKWRRTIARIRLELEAHLGVNEFSLLLPLPVRGTSNSCGPPVSVSNEKLGAREARPYGRLDSPVSA